MTVMNDEDSILAMSNKVSVTSGEFIALNRFSVTSGEQ